MQVRKNLFSCPLYPLLNLKMFPGAQSPSVPSFIPKTNKTKNLTGSTYCFSPLYRGYLDKEKFLIQTDMTKFINTAWLQALYVSSFLDPLHIFSVGSLCQACVVGTLGGVTLARRTRRSRLTVGAGVSWLSLGSGLSRASIFTVTRHTRWP